MLTPYRRHTRKCKFTSREERKCSCPIWCDGELNGSRYRKSLNTRDWARAQRLLGKIEQRAEEGRVEKPMTAAIESFHLQYRESAPETRRKYTRILAAFGTFVISFGITSVEEISVETIDGFKASAK